MSDRCIYGPRFSCPLVIYTQLMPGARMACIPISKHVDSLPAAH